MIITTPSFLAIARSMSSVMLRGAFEIARADEWDATTGARVVSSASKNVLSETCEMSTIIPRRFSSRTTSLPNDVRPSWAGASPDESAHCVLRECVKVRYRTPSAAYRRSTPRSLSIMWPPSTPKSAAILRAAPARRMSAAVVASTKSFGCVRTVSRTASI